MRRSFKVNELPKGRIALRLWSDEDVEVYINGKLVAALFGYTTGYELVEIKPDSFAVGEAVVSIHCYQSMVEQFIDLGIVAIQESGATSK